MRMKKENIKAQTAKHKKRSIQGEVEVGCNVRDILDAVSHVASTVLSAMI